MLVALETFYAPVTVESPQHLLAMPSMLGWVCPTLLYFPAGFAPNQTSFSPLPGASSSRALYFKTLPFCFQGVDCDLHKEFTTLQQKLLHFKMVSEQRHFSKMYQERKMIHSLVYLINSCLNVVCKVITISRLCFFYFFKTEMRHLLSFLSHWAPLPVSRSFDVPWVLYKGSGTHPRSQPC